MCLQKQNYVRLQSPPYIGIVQNESSIQEYNHWEMQAKWFPVEDYKEVASFRWISVSLGMDWRPDGVIGWTVTYNIQPDMDEEV